MRVHTSFNINVMNTQPHFGVNYTELENGGQSRHYRLFTPKVKPNGDIVEIVSTSAHDREQCARNLNTTVIPVREKTKNKVTGALVLATLCLGLGGFVMPPLIFAAACCGITALALLLSRGLKS